MSNKYEYFQFLMNTKFDAKVKQVFQSILRTLAIPKISFNYLTNIK